MQRWPHRQIILLGSSFGATVILSTRFKEPLTYALLGPLTNLRSLRNSLVRVPSGEDDLYHLLKSGYAHVYRGLSQADWVDFLRGRSAVNPRVRVRFLKNKRIMLFQGTLDRVVHVRDTRSYVKRLTAKGLLAKMLLVPKAQHGADLERRSLTLLNKLL